MNFERIARMVVMSLLPLPVWSGCSSDRGSSSAGSGLPAAREGLQDLATLLQSLETEGTKPPMRAAEFRQYDVVFPAAGIMIPNGTLVYFQGGKIDPDSTDQFLIAMQADADETGGWVLLNSGELQELTAVEVQALKPAGKPVL